MVWLRFGGSIPSCDGFRWAMIDVGGWSPARVARRLSCLTATWVPMTRPGRTTRDSPPWTHITKWSGKRDDELLRLGEGRSGNSLPRRGVGSAGPRRPAMVRVPDLRQPTIVDYHTLDPHVGFPINCEDHGDEDRQHQQGSQTSLRQLNHQHPPRPHFSGRDRSGFLSTDADMILVRTAVGTS